MEELTRLEERIMQCIWNYQGEVPFLDLIETVKEKLNKDYKRTSIRGYLFRLEEKGYIKVTKKGRKAYVQPLINEESYGKYQAEKEMHQLLPWEYQIRKLNPSKKSVNFPAQPQNPLMSAEI